MEDIKQKRLSSTTIVVLVLLTCMLSACTSKVSELGPVGQEYVHREGSLTVESAHKVSLWDGRGLPNTFTIKKGHLYNNYGDNVASIRKRGEKLYIHSSNYHVQDAYGGTYTKYDGHFKGYEHFNW